MEKIYTQFNLDEPLYDLSTFIGRYKYFAWVTDPRTVIVPNEKLIEAKNVLERYRAGKEPVNLTPEQLKYNLKLCMSAFHPDTGELQNVAGRMSFQVPGGMLITGAMLAFYRTVPAVVFWQFVNQSFNAVVNYTNRNANSPTSVKQMGIAYVSATSSALIAAIGCKSYWSKRASPIFQRYVPFAAVAAANCVNIPLMRQNEILHGVEVKDKNGQVVGHSRLAAVKGISQVILSRIAMAAPGMLLLPIIMERIERQRYWHRIRWLSAPMQTVLVGCFLCFMVPTACALFPQECTLSTATIERYERELYAELRERCKGKIPRTVYFNKGL